MWQQPYHRDALPDGIDNSDFGQEIPTFDITNKDNSLDSLRTVEDFGVVRFPESAMFGTSRIDPRFTSACEAKIVGATTRAITSDLMFPDHAPRVYPEDRKSDIGALISETLWHSELFFSESFRNDRSTGWKWRVANAGEDLFLVKGAVGLAYHRYHYQYFHWFMDCLVRAWILKRHQPDIRKWYFGALQQRFQVPSLALLDINPEDCLNLRMDTPTRFEGAHSAGFLFEEPLQTLRPDFISGVYHAGWSPEYVYELRDRSQRLTRGYKAFEKIYVSRGESTHRRIVNESEVLAAVERRGFKIITPAVLSFEEQMIAFSKAKVIIGAHGAGLTNMIWSNAGAAVLEFLPMLMPDVGYRFLAPMCGHSHSVLLCETLPHNMGYAYGDVVVDIVNLETALDAVNAY